LYGLNYPSVNLVNVATVGCWGGVLFSSALGIRQLALSLHPPRDTAYQGKSRSISPNKVGRRRSITPIMFDVLCQHLLEKPDRTLEELEVFLWDEFEDHVPRSNISRALRSAGWSRKTVRRVAKEQNPDLRDFYVHNLSFFRSYHLVYVDESGCDRRVGFRRTGWSPLGVSPLQVTQFHRGQRYHILPAYYQDGVMLARVFQGATDTQLFEEFIEQLCWILTGLVTPGAQMDGVKVSDSLSDVACSLSYIYLAVE
jgi:hypothetical protein